MVDYHLPTVTGLMVARDLKERIWPLLESGAIKPVIHATFPLEEASKAHALMESGVHIGKIVLEVIERLPPGGLLDPAPRQRPRPPRHPPVRPPLGQSSGRAVARP